MASDSIGKLSLKIDGETSGLRRSVQESKQDVLSLTQTAVGHIGGMFTKFAAPVAIIAAVKSFHSSLVEMGKAAKELSIAATGAGVSIQWMQKMQFYAEKVGVGMDQIAGALSKIRKEMSASVFGQMDKQLAMKELKLPDSFLRLPQEQAYDMLINKLLGVRDSFKRTQIGMALFEETWFKVEAALRERARGEKISIISDESLSAAKEFGEWWADYSRSWSVWWAEMKGNAAHFMGFGKDADELKKLATQKRYDDEFDARLRAMDAAEESKKKLMREFIQDMHGMSGDEKKLDDVRTAHRIAGLNFDDRQLTALIAQKKELKELASQREEIKKKVEATASAEEKFVQAIREAHKARMAGIVSTREEEQLIKQAKKDLGAAWKSETPQLADLALRGTQEAYRAIAGAQNQEQENQRRLQELTRLMLQAMQATERNTRGIASPPTVAHLN